MLSFDYGAEKHTIIIDIAVIVTSHALYLSKSLRPRRRSTNTTLGVNILCTALTIGSLLAKRCCSVCLTFPRQKTVLSKWTMSPTHVWWKDIFPSSLTRYKKLVSVESWQRQLEGFRASSRLSSSAWFRRPPTVTRKPWSEFDRLWFVIVWMKTKAPTRTLSEFRVPEVFWNHNGSCLFGFRDLASEISLFVSIFGNFIFQKLRDRRRKLIKRIVSTKIFMKYLERTLTIKHHLRHDVLWILSKR